MSKPNELSQEKKKMLGRLFKRSWLVGSAYNNVRGHGHGCLFTLYPLIDKLYPDPEQRPKKIEALKRHIVFYNITPQVNTAGLGLFTAMEEECARNEAFDPTSINAMKAAIMGPMSGIGDALFQVTIRVIAASIGLGLALQGSWLGGLLFLAVFNVCMYVIRHKLFYVAYETGAKLVTKAQDSGVLQLLTRAAAIMGLLMVGGMVASTVKVPLALSWTTAGAEVTLQSFFDAVMPGLLPLGLTLGMMLLVRKKVNANLLMFLLMIVGIAGAWIGLF